jgi:16S rRNA (cytosine967-C5)-methyltransferase
VYASAVLSELLVCTADAVAAVRAGRSLTDALAATPAPQRAGTQALSFAVLRSWGAAHAARRQLAPRAPTPWGDALLTSALALAWPQAERAYPDHTLVDQAVRAARVRAPAASGFVNAVLRRFLRERAQVVQTVSGQPEGRWNHPAWWIERLRQDWPAQWQALLAAAQQHPPMTLRVNARRSTGAQWLQRLALTGRSGRVLDDPAWAGQAVILDAPCAVQELPGFAEGDVSVQDAAAQRAAPLLVAAPGHPPLRAGARVLDACAAPGGKTAHLLELADLEVWALDRDASRLARVEQALERLGLHAHCLAADAGDPTTWWDGRPFDAILLDAPCSGSGVGRRHPDIRWLRRPADLVSLAREQDRLLDALWPLLAPGGRLLYATCSVFRAEGAARIDAFLQRPAATDAELDPASPGHLLGLPDNAQGPPAGTPATTGADGFFYALLHKNP